MPMAGESVGGSEGQNGSQFAVSESTSLRAAASSWGGLQLRELESVKAKIKASLQSVRACLLGPVAHTRPPFEQPQPRCGRSAKRFLEDNTACYCQKKK